MDYLIEHAIRNVWCSPRQDRQFRFVPKRISRNGGEYIQIELDWRTLYLPDNKSYWHVYQVGDLHPSFLGLHPVQNKWISLTDVSNKMGMIAEAYTMKGILLPKFETFYMVTGGRNLVIATKRRDEQLGIDYNEEDINLRVYTNAYFESARSKHLPDIIVTEGSSPKRPQDVLAIQQRLAVYKNKPNGYAYAIINGRFYEDVSPINCKVGDLVDWIYDSSVSKVVEYPIKNLPHFDSILDDERKYLIHYPGKVGRIDYQDDIDLFLIERKAGKPHNGLYHHKHTARAMRMVTHKDYSVSVQLINSFVDDHPDWDNPQTLNIMALIRESGYDRPLVFEDNRLHELYKLKEGDFLSAMIGDNATVDNWHPAVLEAAGYPEVMRASYDEVTRELVQKAYGYNACSKILGDTPTKIETQSGVRMAPLSRGLYDGATVFEYNEVGMLLGWYRHESGLNYIPRQAQCDFIESVVGLGSSQIDDTFDSNTQMLDPKANYRMYICDIVEGRPNNEWRDVTKSGMYVIIDNKLTWLIDHSRYYTLVRSDKIPLVYNMNVQLQDGVLKFDLLYVRKSGNGTPALDILRVPMGELDLTMNGRALIPGIDYVVNYPTVVVFNKEYLDQADTKPQQFVYRMTGFCKEDLSMEQVDDMGFVRYGLISRNGTFNIRDDRVLRFVSGGRVRHPDDLKFSEEHELVILPDSKNGEPYCIRDIVVPMKALTDGDTYAFREKSRVIDKKISQYLTTKLPEPTTDKPNVIPTLYAVYSPFLNAIYHALINNTIDNAPLREHYDMKFVEDQCQPFVWLLDYDPTQERYKYNPAYMTVHPHHYKTVVDVDIYHWTFLDRVIKRYMKDEVALNHHMRLKQF